nr:hypothetical protein [Tanacetum cinerariifolium]
MKSIFETTSQMDAQTPTSVAPLPMTAPTMTPSTIATIATTSQAPILPTTVLSTIIQNLPNFSLLFHFDYRLRTLEANFFQSMQTNQFAGALSAIPKIKIINEQVKEQVKVQVFKILPRIEQTVNEQLEAEVLTRSSHSLKTSYAVAADLSEMERRRDDDADKDEEPSAGPDWGTKRRREGKEPESASAPMETATRSAGRPPVRWKFPHIQSLTQVLKINQLYSLLSILNGLLNNINHHLRIVVGIRLCQLSMEAFNHG